MKENLVIAKILKPQGIKGELKLYPLVDENDSLKSIKNVFIEGVSYKVTSWRINATGVFFTLYGVNDRNACEAFRAKEVECKRDDLKIKEGRYFIADIIGCNLVTDEGKNIGEIVDIMSAKTDVYVVKTEKGEIMFPSAEGVIVEHDLANGKIVVSTKRFAEVTEYAD